MVDVYVDLWFYYQKVIIERWVTGKEKISMEIPQPNCSPVTQPDSQWDDDCPVWLEVLHATL